MFAYRNKESVPDSPQDSDGIFLKFKKMVLSTILLISVLLFSWIAYSSYKYSNKPNNIEEIKLVRRDIAPVRILPAEPGGEVLNNQDKLIYKNFESVRNANSSKKDTPQTREGSKPPSQVNDAYANDKIADAYEEAKPETKKAVAPLVVAAKKDQDSKLVEKKKINSVFDVIE